MNKQQLASKIWASANKLRSKIEANEYKDYILGFIFYKFLSDKEVELLKKQDWEEQDFKELTEEDTETVGFCQQNLGYFIAYDHLFSTWIDPNYEFDVSNVRDALSAFSRLINPAHKKVFDKIFDTLSTGLSKLGDSSGSQTTAISKLLQLIKDIPTDDNQDYDVLGFIYEYLIGNFAANAGKKAGEFYTPHEVALLMAEIVADHLKDREQIEIYDPTSGSGSLLINIGRAVAKHIVDRNRIKYYAQELKENTYNLTRMNLVMRGIIPDNIVTRNGDTLEDDWPYFDDENKESTYQPLYVDAVVSNPPYSQGWEPKGKELDPRYKDFGLAPKGKADYAFLLHDLYHIKPDGIMTIVLPHGVLFRGGDDEKIRRNLIERNHIDAIIGLPGNIFFGTGIATIIMVLRQKRSNTDVLIVDASKGYIKEGKNNKLRACDIRRIADVVIKREEIPNFSRRVSRVEIREKNNYNLNIPRYVDSSEPAETWDLYASMFGNVPNAEIDLLQTYWNAFPSLREALFVSINGTPCSQLLPENVTATIAANEDVQNFEKAFTEAFVSFPEFLSSKIIGQMTTLNIPRTENDIAQEIFRRLENLQLIDKYDAYQILDDNWRQMATDLEIIQTEGFGASRKVDPNMVVKKKKDEEIEVQDGYIGRILPFNLVQHTILTKELNEVLARQNELDGIETQLQELMERMAEEDKERFLSEDGDAFVPAVVAEEVDRILSDVDTLEIRTLQGYILLLDNRARKPEKMAYIAAHRDVKWSAIEANQDGTYSKNNVNKYVSKLVESYQFPEDSTEAILIEVNRLFVKEKALKKEIKIMSENLHQLTRTTIESLDDDQIVMLLKQKWFDPLCERLATLPHIVVDGMARKLKALVAKYDTSYIALNNRITEAEQALSALLGDLTGSDTDMEAIAQLKSLLKVNNYE